MFFGEYKFYKHKKPETACNSLEELNKKFKDWCVSWESPE